MLKTAIDKLDITRRDLRNLAAATAILTALFAMAVDVVVPAQVPHGATCSLDNFIR